MKKSCNVCEIKTKSMSSLIKAKTVEDIDTCLKNGHKIDDFFSDDWLGTAFEYHCYNGKTKLAKHLVSKGCKITITAFNYVCNKGHFELFEFLSTKVDINELSNENVTPLMSACSGNQIFITNALLNMGADPNKTNRWGETAGHFASQYGCVELINLLFTFGANLNAEHIGHQTLLHRAVEGNNYDVVKKLLDLKVDVTRIDKHGNTPLMIAELRNYQKIINELKNN